MPFDLLFIILGLVIGSFLAAYSYRLPKDISIAEGRSFCPNCKKQIEWYDNIPLISFLLLMGKCRQCHSPISYRYFLIELSTALGFLAISKTSGDLINLIFMLIMFSILVLIFVIDFENQIIPDNLVFAGILLTFVKLLLVDNRSLFEALLSGFLASSFLFAIHLITKGKGMGLGDVKFAILGGLLMGPKLSFIWLFLSFLTGALVGIILIIGKAAKFKDKIAFGPFLIIGLVATYIWGRNLLFLIF